MDVEDRREFRDDKVDHVKIGTERQNEEKLDDNLFMALQVTIEKHLDTCERLCMYVSVEIEDIPMAQHRRREGPRRQAGSQTSCAAASRALRTCATASCASPSGTITQPGNRLVPP